jgi:hypothetical protein
MVESGMLIGEPVGAGVGPAEAARNPAGAANIARMAAIVRTCQSRGWRTIGRVRSRWRIEGDGACSG